MNESVHTLDKRLQQALVIRIPLGLREGEDPLSESLFFLFSFQTQIPQEASGEMSWRTRQCACFPSNSKASGRCHGGKRGKNKAKLLVFWELESDTWEWHGKWQSGRACKERERAQVHRNPVFHVGFSLACLPCFPSRELPCSSVFPLIKRRWVTMEGS